MLTKNDALEKDTEIVQENAATEQSSTAFTIRFLAQCGLMVFILFLGFSMMNYLTSQKESPPTRPAFQTVYTVNTVIAERGFHQPKMLVYGEIQATRSIDLRSLVAGKVIGVNPDLKVGGRIEAGDKLFKIDPFAFEKELAMADANLAETRAKIEENRARIRIEESRIRSLKDQLAFAKSDLDRIASLRKNGTATEKQVEDRSLLVSQRTQALEQSELNLVAEKSRLQQLEAVLDRFDWNRKQASRNIEDTVLRAPVTAVVNSKNVAVGRLINANDVAVSLYEADQLEVRFTLTDQRFARIQSDDVGVVGREVEVIWSVGGDEFRYAAMIDRISARIASNRGGVEVIAIIKEDLAGSALRPGAFVEIVVPDQAFKSHFKIPETALYNDDNVYVVIDGKLVAEEVTVNARDEDQIIISGNFPDGSEILTTRIAEISEGLSVRSPQNANSTSKAGNATTSETQ